MTYAITVYTKNKNKKQPDTLGKEGRAPYHGVQGEALTERGNFLKLEVYTLLKGRDFTS